MKKSLWLATGFHVLLLSLQARGQATTTQTPDRQPEIISLMPYPQSLQTGSGKLRITPDFTISLSGAVDDKTLEGATNRFLRRLNARTLVSVGQEDVILNQPQANAAFVIQVKQKAGSAMGVDETYQLTVDERRATLTAANTVGALHGLETILQLIQADADGYYVPQVSITDAPRYRWRGMMIDVARHFLPFELLKRNIDAMAMVKLNVLHLHLSDDEGFRVESKVFPKLHELGSKGQYYTQTELKDLVRYAAARGILVYPEFDLPGHSTSWFAGYPELASAPGPYRPDHRYKLKPGTPRTDLFKIITESATPTLDPTKETIYTFLDRFIGEMTTIFPAPYLHIGADENNGAAWKQNPEIVQFMAQKGIKDVHGLQAYFVQRMHTLLKKHHRTTLGWEELYRADLPKDVIVQVWGALGSKRPSPLEIARQGHPVIISKGFYLDYFYPAYFHYLNSSVPSASHPNLLGGEIALWAELLDENSFEGRAWPRSAAIAERLWSPQTVTNVDDMYRRLFVISDRLEEAGLNHRLNTERMLSGLANGQPIQNPLLVLQTLAPARGPGRIAAQFMAPERTKYQSVPLVDLADLVSPDSKAAWQFRKGVEAYLVTKDANQKALIVNQLIEWKRAASQLPALLKTAPNLQELAGYAAKVAQAATMALEVLESAPDEKVKAERMQTLKALKSRGDKLEILILPEIMALVSGTLAPLPTSFSAF